MQMMHPHNKENQVVTAQAYIISCYPHTPISCKLLTKFTHKPQLSFCRKKHIKFQTLPNHVRGI